MGEQMTSDYHRGDLGHVPTPEPSLSHGSGSMDMLIEFKVH